ncbi:FecCD family ABC transporter permease [Streptosporangium sp. DT93]|uniref:FecCD family ABC transporter permease n=1 Tax=Streptosporangium sp. DT93 TaxID=3393428 RepID=UPI003CF07C35
MTLRTRGGRIALRWDRRTVAVCLGLLAVLAAAAVVAIGTGTYEIVPADVLRTLLGEGTRAQEFAVQTLRLPRVLTALLAGAALGAAGAVFQSLSRNPLGSPDIVGFTTGASTGALIQIIVLGGGMVAVATGALLGGLATSLVVYLLAFRGGVEGYRLILVGIAVNGGLVAANTYLVARAEFADAHIAVTWMTGNLNGRSWEHVWLLLLTLVPLMAWTLWLGGRLRMMEMGDEAAVSLGVRVERSKLALMLAGVALTAMATVAGGPIPFVALAAPQLARRLTGATGPGPMASALMGATLLLVCDLAAQRVIEPSQLPVGVMTGSLGGTYLVWLLLHEWRRSRG